MSAEDPTQEQPASSQTPPEHEASANGIQEAAVPTAPEVTTNHRSEESPTENSDTEELKVEHNSTAAPAAGHENIVTGKNFVNEDSVHLQDGEAGTEELGENFRLVIDGSKFSFFP